MRNALFLILAATFAAPSFGAEVTRVEFAERDGNTILLNTDSGETPTLAVQRTDAGLTFELVSSQGVIVSVHSFVLTGPAANLPHATAWKGVYDGCSISGSLVSPVDQDSYVQGAPTRLYMQFTVDAMEARGDAKPDAVLPEFRPISLLIDDAQLLGTVLRPARITGSARSDVPNPGRPRGDDGVRFTEAESEAEDLAVAAWPQLLTICGCNPTTLGYPQTVCASSTPCSAACPGAPGSCGWYIVVYWISM